MTEGTRVDRKPWKRTLPWAVALLLIVLVLPMATFGRNMLFRGGPAATSPDAAPVFSGGAPYVTRELFSLPAGDGPAQASVGVVPGEGQVSTVEVVAPSPDGDHVWVVDHPAGMTGARIQRFGTDGRLEGSFVSQPASTLFTPGVQGDLWAVRSSGSGQETLVHYRGDGAVAREYPMPEGLVVRSIAVDPDGEIWVQYEEWIVEPQTNNKAYSSTLTPIVQADGSPVPDVTPDKSADGAFLGADDRIYWPSTKPDKVTDNTYPPFVVIARDSKGERVTEYDIDDGGRPFAADAAGRVYTETLLVDPGQAPGASTIGDAAYSVVQVGVQGPGGERANLRFTRQPQMGLWAPTAWPTADGHLVSWRWEQGRLLILSSEPVGSEPLVADAAPKAADAQVFMAALPSSGDPYRARDAAERDLWQAVYSGLVAFDASLTAAPDLAEAVPRPGAGVSGDGLSVTWRLRSGREFHDGSPVTGDDVVATWEYLRGTSPLSASEPFPGFELIESVEADGQTVVVKLSRPFGVAPEAFFPYVLPRSVVKEAVGQSNGGLYSRPIGSGPYRVARWDSERLQLTKVGDTLAGLGVIDVVAASGEGARARYMGAAVPTVWSWVPEADVAVLQRDAVGSLALSRTGRWFGLVVNSEDGVVANKSLRTALLDTYPSSMVRDLYGLDGTTTVAPFGQDIPIDTYGSGKESASRLARALDAAGYSKIDKDNHRVAGGQWLRLRYSQTMRGPEQHETVSEVEGEYKKVVDSTKAILDWENGQHNFYAPVDCAGFLSRGRHQIGSGVFPGFLDAGWGSVFDPATTPSWSRPYGMGVTFSRDPELASLHERASRSYDAEVRRELGERILKKVRSLRLAYFDRPEVRPVAVLGVAGVDPAPFPAGLFHNIDSWTVEGER